MPSNQETIGVTSFTCLRPIVNTTSSMRHNGHFSWNESRTRWSRHSWWFTIVAPMNTYFKVNSSVLLHRRDFLHAAPGASESASEFAFWLRRQVNQCDFISFEQSLLRDVFVIGTLAWVNVCCRRSIDVRFWEGFGESRSAGDGQIRSRTVRRSSEPHLW